MRLKSDLRRGAALATGALLLLSSATALAQQPAPPIVQLWPNGAPGSEQRHGEPETVKDNTYYSNIHDPSLTVLRGLADVVIVVLAFSWWLIPLVGLGVFIWMQRRRPTRPTAPPPAPAEASL